jgi:hypothetical protein
MCHDVAFAPRTMIASSSGPLMLFLMRLRIRMHLMVLLCYFVLLMHPMCFIIRMIELLHPMWVPKARRVRLVVTP